nr:GDYXXLXY domain-containing protein [Myroides marinus]
MITSKKNLVIIAVLVLIGVFFIRAVSQKENTIEQGQLVLLELAPVDPRSLMQGDYMTLNYAISTPTSTVFSDSLSTDFTSNIEREVEDAVEKSKLHKRGYVLLSLDKNNVGHLVKMQNEMGEKAANQIYIKYFNYEGWRFNIGAESFFFQEGEAEKYEAAKYGALRVDDKGNSVLVGMYDEKLKPI